MRGRSKDSDTESENDNSEYEHVKAKRQTIVNQLNLKCDNKDKEGARIWKTHHLSKKCYKYEKYCRNIESNYRDDHDYYLCDSCSKILNQYIKWDQRTKESVELQEEIYLLRKEVRELKEFIKGNGYCNIA